MSKDQPQVVELHKRLKVMQGKLDKQREQVKGMEVALKAAQHKPHPSGMDGGTPLKGEGPMAVNTEKQPPTIDHKVTIYHINSHTTSITTPPPPPPPPPLPPPLPPPPPSTKQWK